MVRGLDFFRDHFKAHEDKYVLIGGTACDIAMSRMGFDFRATKDLDIVLIVEALDTDFFNTFWDFVTKGKYKNKQKSTDRKQFYRFYDPEIKTFPYMLELFSRKPNVLNIPTGVHLTPIPIDEEVLSLSAILMERDYYDFIQNGKTIKDNLSVITEEYLIPLKARAYLDLSERKSEGESIDSKDIKKHKNDVFRLYQLLSPEKNIVLHKTIAKDMRLFMDTVIKESPDLKNLGIKNTTIEEVIKNLKKIYSLG